MSEETKAKRKAKVEEGPEKKQKVDNTSATFEVQPEVENFQREALWRSLQDYKRRGLQSQEQLEKLQKSSRYHDDHLRVVDMWWDHLLDEVQIIARQASTSSALEPVGPTLAQHFLSTIPEFSRHLEERRQNILHIITTCIRELRNVSQVTDASKELEEQNIQLIGQLKLLRTQVQQLQLEKDEREPKIADLQERLASSQRKIDRQKSITLARIEAQARRAPSNLPANDKPDEVKASTAAMVKEETTASASQVEAQPELDQSPILLEELQKLTSDLSRSKDEIRKLEHRLQHLSESDIQQSLPFSNLRSKNEHLQGRFEHLEKSHAESTQELADLRAARSKYEETFVAEHDTQYKEVLAQLAKAEQDLARVRTARDDLHASLQLKKAQDDAKAASAREIGELADAQATRIAALEAEVSRLKVETQPTHKTNGMSNGSMEDLQQELARLHKENESLKDELPTMEKAFNQAHEQNMRKVMELVSVEDKIAKLQAEKAKADQKYFAAMKAKDQMAVELKTTKAQYSKTTEAVSRLQESDEAAKQQIQNLEKQISNHEKMRDRYRQEMSKLSESLEESKRALDQARNISTEARNRAENKEQELLTIRNAERAQTQELESCKKQLERLKSLSTMTNGSNDDQVQVYRGIAMCSVCNLRWKDTAITSCGHVFCKECVDKRVETRQRRCPNCNKGFGSGDILSVHL